jgi:uracil phosphoribosyltransferase
MIHDLSRLPSLLTQFVAEIRDVEIQNDRLRFRKNLERIGEIMAYEISRQVIYQLKEVRTPLGKSNCSVLGEQPILGTVLRAGLALHQGLLNFFDGADTAYVSAFRKHRPDGSFEIELEYVSCPRLDGRILILSDPMLATGSSIALTIKELLVFGRPKEIHLVCAVACTVGIERVMRECPELHVWAAAIDPELDSNFYIVPGLGDAGDLAFGEKAQR